ncbi:MAG: hypothetical protein ABH812_00780 [bacterium]
MKKTRINLLVNKNNFADILKYFRLFRISLISVSALLLIFTIIMGILVFNQNKKITTLTNEKQENEGILNTKKEDEVKLIKITNKLKDIETFSKNDANFYPYYQVFTQSLNQSSESASVDNLNIDKDKKFNFTLSFSDMDSMLESFKFIESDEFLKNFSSIYLKGLETEEKQGAKIYKIAFEGQFIDINENTN